MTEEPLVTTMRVGEWNFDEPLATLEIRRDPWPIAATLMGFANLVLLAVLVLR